MQLGYNEYGVYQEEQEPDYSDEPVIEEDDDDEEDTEYTIDFDLAKWVKDGKLLWITPDDPTFTLKTGTSGCPYLNLQGSRQFSVLFDGELVEQEEEEN